MKKVENNFISFNQIILYLLPVLGVVGIIFPLIIGQSNLSLLGTYLAIPMILAPILCIKQKEYKNNFTLNTKLFSLFISFYFICTSISIYLLYIFEIRPIFYYLIIAIISSSILLEILLFDISDKKEIIILLQIMILIVNIIWGVTLKYNFFIGRTDILGHAWFVENLIMSSYVTNIFDIYKPFPLWHILCAFMQAVLETFLSTEKLMFFTNGLIYSFVPIESYLVSIYLFKDKKISLLSALFVSLNPDIIFYGMYSISRSVVSFLEIILVLVLLDANNPKKVLISILLTLSLIIYHTASMPFILLILLTFHILKKIYAKVNRESFLSTDFVVLSISMTLFYWMYYAPGMLKNIIHSILTPASSGIITDSIILTPLNELLNYLQYSPILFFVIIGFFAALQSQKISTLGKLFCILGLLAVPVTFPGPSLLINKLSGNFNLARFGEYTFLFIGLTSAIGFHELYTKSKRYTKIFSILLFITMVFLAVSNDFNASDNPLVKRPFYTFYLTDEEEITFGHLASMTQGEVMSDYVTDRYLSYSKYENKSHIIEVDRKNAKFLRNQTGDIFLIRNLELTKRPLKLYSSHSGNFILNESGSDNYDYFYQNDIYCPDLFKYNKIYDSRNISGFN